MRGPGDDAEVNMTQESFGHQQELATGNAPVDIGDLSPAQVARFSDPGGGIVWAADSPEAREALRIDAEWGDLDPDNDPDSPPSDAEMSPLDREREGLAFTLWLTSQPNRPGASELTDEQRDWLARYRDGTLTPMVRTNRYWSPDETPEGADWTKATWDLPPYKSRAFMALIDDLEAFHRLPVYRFAVVSGLIVNDEWNGDAQAPVEQRRPGR
jgi:hypothetical protein